MLKSHQRGDLTPAETKVHYLPFTKVLRRFFTKKEMDSSYSARRMEALYYHVVKRTKVPAAPWVRKFGYLCIQEILVLTIVGSCVLT